VNCLKEQFGIVAPTGERHQILRGFLIWKIRRRRRRQSQPG
jgi:hypothetical protein